MSTRDDPYPVRRGDGPFRYQVMSVVCLVLLAVGCVVGKRQSEANQAHIKQERATAVQQLLAGRHVAADEVEWLTVGEPQFVPADGEVDDLVESGHISEEQAQKLKIMSDVRIYFRYEPSRDTGE